jgi:hypothetical protein
MSRLTTILCDTALFGCSSSEGGRQIRIFRRTDA